MEIRVIGRAYREVLLPHPLQPAPVGVAHGRVGLEPHPAAQPVVVDGGDERPVGIVSHLGLDDRGERDELVPREVQRIEPGLPLRGPRGGELLRHHPDELSPPDAQRQQVRRREQIPLGAGRCLRQPEPGEQGGIFCGIDKRIPRDAELGLGELCDLDEPQALAHRETLLHPATPLQRGDDVAPRFVLPQQVDAALERPGEPAHPGVQAEQSGMPEHPIRREGVDGRVERRARRNGHGDAGAVGGAAGGEGERQQNAERGSRNAERSIECRAPVPRSAFRLPRSHVAPPRRASR